MVIVRLPDDILEVLCFTSVLFCHPDRYLPDGQLAPGQKYIKGWVVVTPFSSDRQYLSYDDCLEVRGEIIRTVLCCIVY